MTITTMRDLWAWEVTTQAPWVPETSGRGYSGPVLECEGVTR